MRLLSICLLLLAGCATAPVAIPVMGKPITPPLPDVITQPDVAAKVTSFVIQQTAPLVVTMAVAAHWADNPLAYGYYATAPLPYGPWTVATNFPIPPGGGWVCYTNTCTNQMNFIVAGSAAINATPPTTTHD